MKKFISILLPLILIVSVLGYFFGHQSFVVITTLYKLRDVDILDQIPKEITMNLDSREKAKRSLTFYGYIFDVPWENIDKERMEKDFSSKAFDCGISILVAKPKKIPGIKNTLLSKTPNMNNKTIGLFGKEMLINEYSFIHSMLNVTKKSLSIFESREETLRKSILLVMKNIYVPLEAETGIYSFRINGFSGFQFGDSSLKHRKITLRFFDNHDIEFNIILYVPKEKKAVLNQNEINCIINSIRKPHGSEQGT